jgi:hypothetical protein
VVSMKITPVSIDTGLWTDFSPTPQAPLPVLVEITLTAIGQDTAKKLENSAWSYTNSLLVSGAAQTLTTRIHVGQKQ